MINKYADPIEDAREDLTLSEAQDVAREDASLLYVDAASLTALRTEAAAAGDAALVNICYQALAGNGSAMRACVDVVLDAMGQ